MIGLGFLLLLIIKVVVSALVVVVISAAVEHSGPVVGGVLMGLPVTAGPGYVFLAIQSTPHFVAQSALFSFMIVAANMFYIMVYLLVVRHFRPLATAAAGLAGWFACAIMIKAAPATLWFGLGLNTMLLLAAIPLIRASRSPFQRLRRSADRRELLLRALSAGALVAVVVTASEAVGSSITGIAMLFPITLMTIGWIMQSRYTPEEASSVMAGALIAQPGFGLSIMLVYLLAERTGAPVALAVCLLASFSWAAATLWLRRAAAKAR